LKSFGVFTLQDGGIRGRMGREERKKGHRMMGKRWKGKEGKEGPERGLVAEKFRLVLCVVNHPPCIVCC
jgi:hypothetical protein